jgi:predicted metal-binding membrane protein
MTSGAGTSGAGAHRRLGIPPLQRWTRAELALAGLLLAVSAAGWLFTHQLAMPGMRVGILTGTHSMDEATQPAMDEPMQPLPATVVLFVGTWMVMMAAMMLPAIAPFTVGMTRIMRTGGAGVGGTAALTAGYFVVWTAAGLVAYLVLRGFEVISAGSGTAAARAGALVLLVAGIYQFTSLKRVCLRHCRSPALLVMQHGQRAVRSRFGAFRAGISHGGYCLGCCWALMAVLLATGVMSLVWMGIVAAFIAVEKVHRRGETIGRVLGGVLVAAAVAVLIEPGVVAVLA